MDTLSHLAIGTAIAALAPAGAHPAVLWGAVIGAQLPDADVVVRYVRGRVAALKHHRGPTHGLLVQFGWAGIVAGLFSLLWPGAPFGTVYLWTLIGLLSHVVSDVLNDYGTQALWPFSNRWIAWDTLPITDMFWLAMILLGWLLAGFTALTRQQVFPYVWLAIAIYTAVRLLLHQRAFQLVKNHFDLKDPCGDHVKCAKSWKEERLTIHPLLFSIRTWRYVLQRQGEYLTGMVSPLSNTVGAPKEARNDYDRFVVASMRSDLISPFISWVRRPRVQVKPMDGGLWQVTWSDVRYERNGYSPFAVHVFLDDDLNLVDDNVVSAPQPRMDGARIRAHLRAEAGREELDAPNTSRV